MFLTVDEFKNHFGMPPKQAGLAIDNIIYHENKPAPGVRLRDDGGPSPHTTVEVLTYYKAVPSTTHNALDACIRKDEGKDVMYGIVARRFK